VDGNEDVGGEEGITEEGKGKGNERERRSENGRRDWGLGRKDIGCMGASTVLLNRTTLFVNLALTTVGKMPSADYIRCFQILLVKFYIQNQ
jgi:hypothetical protein